MRWMVDAQFVMRNLGAMQESFDDWLPLAASSRYPDILEYDLARLGNPDIRLPALPSDLTNH